MLLLFKTLLGEVIPKPFSDTDKINLSTAFLIFLSLLIILLSIWVLSNMDRDKGNKVDGTKGDWTLQEGEEDLFVINNISGKKYKIALIPQDDESDNRGDP